MGTRNWDEIRFGIAALPALLLLSVCCISACCNCPNKGEAASADDATTEPVAETPSDDAQSENSADESMSAPTTDSAAEPAAAASSEAPAAAPKSDLPEPKFTPGMSVNEAISAVPQGWEYIGVEPDALGRPLSDLTLYAPCKLTPSHHFKLRVAVWNGRAVGIDVSSPSKPLAACVREQVEKVEWRDKVKAINTVDFAY